MSLFSWLVVYSLVLTPVAAMMSPAKNKVKAGMIYYPVILGSVVLTSLLPFVR